MQATTIVYKSIEITSVPPNVSVTSVSADRTRYVGLGNYGSLKEAFEMILKNECSTSPLIKKEIEELRAISEKADWNIEKTKVEAMRAIVDIADQNV